MNRRTMLATLATAALLPTTRLFADGAGNNHGSHKCDRKFAKMITALEHFSWDISKTHDLKAAQAFFADDFFETLAFGGAPSSRQDLLDLIASGEFTVYDYTFTEDFVVRTTATSALINYRIVVNYDYYGANYTDDLRATSSYGLIQGRWRCTSYHETYSYIPEPTPA